MLHRRIQLPSALWRAIGKPVAAQWSSPTKRSSWVIPLAFFVLFLSVRALHYSVPVRVTTAGKIGHATFGQKGGEITGFFSRDQVLHVDFFLYLAAAHRLSIHICDWRCRRGVGRCLGTGDRTTCSIHGPVSWSSTSWAPSSLVIGGRTTKQVPCCLLLSQ